jgi:hypothetical protein
MWLQYGQFGYLSSDKVADLSEAICHNGEHTNAYAYNLCDCLECPPLPDPPSTVCTAAKQCEADYDYRKHDIMNGCAPFTPPSPPSPPMPLPPSNCPTPEGSTACHFWGDPHFTHIFGENMREAKKGGRQHGSKLFDWNPTGVFELASNADESFEAQVFFCPYHGTSTGVGLAMRFGDDLIQVVRGDSTADKNKPGGYGAYTGAEEDWTEFFMNGDRVSWSELGDATGTRGKDVRGNGGVTAKESYLQQLKTNHESALTFLPVCAGNGKDTVVEVGTPAFGSVYEHAVTIRTSNPGVSGVCSGGHISTWENGNGEQFRVERKNLFSTNQMKDLCGMCGLAMHSGVCGAPSHPVPPEKVCESAGADIAAAQEACGKEFEKDSDWFSVCVMETCVSGDGAVAISRIEEHLQETMDADES